MKPEQGTESRALHQAGVGWGPEDAFSVGREGAQQDHPRGAKGPLDLQARAG